MQRPRTRPHLRLLRAGAVTIGLALLVAACTRTGSDDVASATATPPSETPAATPPETPATTPAETPTPLPEPVGERVVNVYWLRDTQLAVGGRIIATASVAQAAVDALLAGPNELETSLAMVNMMPAGTEVLGLNIADGLATIDFSSEFEATGLGTAGELGLVAQVVYTLTQFPTVESVTITIEGEPREAILSHGLQATNLTRAGLADAVSPGILVESPYPGQTVSSPVTISGQSRTFESTVVFEVTDAAGAQIGFGFTTASQPDVGVFGPFSFDAELTPGSAGAATVIAFEESAEDGRRINIYEVPVTLAP